MYGPCGIPIAKVVRVAAALDAVVSLAFFFMITVELVFRADNSIRGSVSLFSSATLPSLVISAVVTFVRVPLAVVLHRGARARDRRRCRIWLALTTILNASLVLSFVIYFSLTGVDKPSLTAVFIIFLYSVCEMVIVYAFLLEPEEDNSTPGPRITVSEDTRAWTRRAAMRNQARSRHHHSHANNSFEGDLDLDLPPPYSAVIEGAAADVPVATPEEQMKPIFPPPPPYYHHHEPENDSAAASTPKEIPPKKNDS